MKSPRFIASLGALLLVGCHSPTDIRYFHPSQAGQADQKGTATHIVILATNDIHGSIEDQKSGSTEESKGGMAFWGGVILSTRAGIAAQSPHHGGVLVVDGGDQFQGTLISNINEGRLVFDTMSMAGYDAVVPGNHAFDFGPVGWLCDKPNADKINCKGDQDPRGALKTLLGQKPAFDLISSNIYQMDSLKDSKGKKVQVSQDSCAPVGENSAAIDWAKAQRLSLFAPYTIKVIDGVRVALIGIDNPATAPQTTPENVSDLCFRNVEDAYTETANGLVGQADVFVMMVHDGDAYNSTEFSSEMEKYVESKKAPLDAVVAGHTHALNHVLLGGRVPMIQSGANGSMFGRIDLYWDETAHKLQDSNMRYYAGVTLYHSSCDVMSTQFCSVNNGKVSYEGIPVEPRSDIQAAIAEVRSQIDPIAKQKLGAFSAEVKVDRIEESPLADWLSDQLRFIGKADVAMLNTGGIRASLPEGDFTYEDLFRVLPFNNHEVIVSPMKATDLVKLLQKSVETCGAYGSLMQSGLKVKFSRNCAQPKNQLDPDAKLLHVETLDGHVLLDTASRINPSQSLTLSVATLDFLAVGGAGYTDFETTPVTGDLGIFRELLKNELASKPLSYTGTTDGRWDSSGPVAKGSAQ